MIESEAYSELSQTSKVGSFGKIVNSFKKITIFIIYLFLLLNYFHYLFIFTFILKNKKKVFYKSYLKNNKIFDGQDSEYTSANIFELYPQSTFYCWTFESIETSSHFLLLETQIKN